ncbi:NADH:ubiquinone oxidoreductase subunit NDUFA12 [Rhodobacteraceae bacterium RKSG542]|uniref:NADH:ubiquinone oxidoreductase subunit NDUFA12 n=1 Tax=Pseudovibrio flavus TaxID=2529854 RepID=UPI0012BBD1CC|nr:NADH:ubiquinone oxidoreductase subunit NDUFA12 [Pseudovibrio flavus]MTI15797.1 NADH:ubiquinone oxidoreductase subunit NDUFA12 [Pseudovibrio flavus]
MKTFLLQLFTWWGSETMGTRFFTWKKGIVVGDDEYGNRYYKERNGKRRWVIYNGEADASKIPPGWHGWMHHRTDVPPSESNYEPRDWELGHKPNPTGSPQAYRPKGSILSGTKRDKVSGDYEAWTPGQ